MSLTTSVTLVFILGYLAIAFEHFIRVNKAASALIAGTVTWTLIALFSPHDASTAHSLSHRLAEQMGEISQILFFLLGAMVIVELIDAHSGFDVISSQLRIKSKRLLLITVCVITFFLSAILDNLTTTIVMITMVRKILDNREDRLFFAGMIVVAANAGGAWSPLGDVTTTMLWIGGQISAAGIIRAIFVPSAICMIVPLIVVSMRLKGGLAVTPTLSEEDLITTPREKMLVLCAGISILLFVPLYKVTTGLPPFMGMLCGLGLLWLVVECLHHEKDEAERGVLSVNHALRKIDAPSILFFLGILLTVAALDVVGVLQGLAGWIEVTISDIRIVGYLIGLLSALIDNVPLVAAAQSMYPLTQYSTDHFFWEYLAYCAGNGGSGLIIGSAAGVAAMGLERIDFFWYLKRISGLAILGYTAGALYFVL
jgi:Na+/H+ antiporter NhaD/arsenite permease-like protein